MRPAHGRSGVDHRAPGRSGRGGKGRRTRSAPAGGAGTACRHGASTTRPPMRTAAMQIFVGNLAYTTTEPELRQWFEVYGVVASVHIPDDPVMGRSRGYGFVDMPDATAAQAAIDALNETMRGGR